VTSRRFALPGFRGEAAESFAVADLAAEAARLADPAAATKTIHWGRNYLYLAHVATASGPLDVVVKQFRPATGWRARIGRARIGWHLAGREGKAARSWRIGRALAAAGIPTPEPLLLLESESGGAASIYVCRHLADRVEARYLLRARNAGREGVEFPAIDFAAFLAATARLARRLHDAGFWHRDFSIGNLLVRPGATPAEIAEIALVDLNRCRAGRPVSLAERMRDLARLALERAEDRRLLLALYFGDARAVPGRARLVYELARRSFHGRHRVKNRLRGAWASVKSWLVPRGAHPHIPPPPADAAPRDRIVWDALSDQPHSHAGRLGRLGARLADLPDHARSLVALAGAAPRIRRRYRELVVARNAEPFAWPGVGVGLRPWPANRGRCSTRSSRSGSGTFCCGCIRGSASTTRRRRWRARSPAPVSSSPSRCRRIATWCAIRRAGARRSRSSPSASPPSASASRSARRSTARSGGCGRTANTSSSPRRRRRSCAAGRASSWAARR
jgi:hypothetical protein